ncbi:hypothetical protein [Dactylosporangium sp. NPDC000521]|uniref:hypothetical protein n=1 Tax=Dactylosporangium sp. NPDC000521 TaxID=3363975 RepID=UPI003676DE2B
MLPLFLTDYVRERHADLLRDAEAHRVATACRTRRTRVRLPIRRRTAAAES